MGPTAYIFQSLMEDSQVLPEMVMILVEEKLMDGVPNKFGLTHLYKPWKNLEWAEKKTSQDAFWWEIEGLQGHKENQP